MSLKWETLPVNLAVIISMLRVCAGQLRCANQEQNEVIWLTAGQISSYTIPSSYARTTQCTWIIASEQTKRLTLSFTSFSISSGDYIRVYSCSDQYCYSQSELAGSPFSGYNRPPALNVWTGVMMIVFYSKSNKYPSSFAASFSGTADYTSKVTETAVPFFNMSKNESSGVTSGQSSAQTGAHQYPETTESCPLRTQTKEIIQDMCTGPDKCACLIENIEAEKNTRICTELQKGKSLFTNGIINCMKRECDEFQFALVFFLLSGGGMLGGFYLWISSNCLCAPRNSSDNDDAENNAEDLEEGPAPIETMEVDCADGVDEGEVGILAQLCLEYMVRSIPAENTDERRSKQRDVCIGFAWLSLMKRLMLKLFLVVPLLVQNNSIPVFFFAIDVFVLVYHAIKKSYCPGSLYNDIHTIVCKKRFIKEFRGGRFSLWMKFFVGFQGYSTVLGTAAQLCTGACLLLKAGVGRSVLTASEVQDLVLAFMGLLNIKGAIIACFAGLMFVLVVASFVVNKCNVKRFHSYRGSLSFNIWALIYERIETSSTNDALKLLASCCGGSMPPVQSHLVISESLSGIMHRKPQLPPTACTMGQVAVFVDQEVRRASVWQQRPSSCLERRSSCSMRVLSPHVQPVSSAASSSSLGHVPAPVSDVMIMFSPYTDYSPNLPPNSCHDSKEPRSPGGNAALRMSMSLNTEETGDQQVFPGSQHSGALTFPAWLPAKTAQPLLQQWSKEQQSALEDMPFAVQVPMGLGSGQQFIAEVRVPVLVTVPHGAVAGQLIAIQVPMPATTAYAHPRVATVSPTHLVLVSEQPNTANMLDSALMNNKSGATHARDCRAISAETVLPASRGQASPGVSQGLEAAEGVASLLEGAPVDSEGAGSRGGMEVTNVAGPRQNPADSMEGDRAPGAAVDCAVEISIQPLSPSSINDNGRMAVIAGKLHERAAALQQGKELSAKLATLQAMAGRSGAEKE